MNFEINLIFLIKPFFLDDQKVMKKNLNILRSKRSRFGIFELLNQVTKPSHADLTLRVANSKIFIEILLSVYWLKVIKH